MKFGRGPVGRAVRPVLVMCGVVSLLIFFYSDTSYHSQSRHQGLRSEQSGSEVIRSKKENPELHLTDKYNAVPASPVTSRGRDVIVVSLARSGSSFTGDVVSHAPGVFYVFEPLRQVEKVYKQQQFGSDQQAALQWWRNQTQGILQHFLSCDFTAINLSLLDRPFLHRAKRTRLLGRCVAQHVRQANVSACVLQAQQNCRRTENRALKVIRLSVRDLLPLLTSRPDLALVLLVRDPRASLWSRVNVFNNTIPLNLSALILNTCQRLHTDVTTVMEGLPADVKDRVRILRYEALAAEPLRMARQLYSFLGLTWSPDVERHIQAQTGSGWRDPFSSTPRLRSPQGVNPAYSVTKGDSVAASRAWRFSVQWPFVQALQRQCFGVMRMLGYSLFRSEQDLRDPAVLSYDRQGTFLEDTGIMLQ